MIVSRLLFLMTLVSTFGCSQESRFDQFVSQFDESKLPINNFELVKPKKYLEVNKKKIDKNLITEFVYEGDQSKIKYSYDKIDYFEGKIIGKETREYTFSPVYKITTNQLTIIVFFRSGANEMKYFMALFDKEHRLTDLLPACETHDDSEINELLASKIDEKNILTIVRYFANPEIKDKVFYKSDTVSLAKTIIEIKKYHLTNFGKFVIDGTSLQKSSCFVNDFFVGISKCSPDNPLAE